MQLCGCMPLLNHEEEEEKLSHDLVAWQKCKTIVSTKSITTTTSKVGTYSRVIFFCPSCFASVQLLQLCSITDSSPAEPQEQSATSK